MLKKTLNKIARMNDEELARLINNHYNHGWCFTGKTRQQWSEDFESFLKDIKTDRKAAIKKYETYIY